MKNYKNYVLTLAVLGSLISFGTVTLAKVDRVDAGFGPWDLTGTYTIDFVLSGNHYSHTMNITTVDLLTGNFSGTGVYNPDNSYTWDVTGNVSGDNLAFTIVYTGSNPGYTLNAVGTIAPDGTLSGTATGPGQNFTWSSTSGAATHELITYRNHGQYVSSQTGKQEAAQSRIGMPVDSEGHTE